MKVLYHANCNDGTASALAAWKHIGEETSTGEKVEYIPVQYGSLPPNIGAEEVFILDFSYPLDVLVEMARKASRVTVIDHHKSASESLSDARIVKALEAAGVPKYKLRVIFDLGKSGARLTWEYFHPGTPVPELIRLVEDRDLWRYGMEGTKAISYGLQVYDADFRNWDSLVEQPILLKGVCVKGQAIIDFLDEKISSILESSQDENGLLYLARLPGPGDYKVPIFNASPFIASDLLNTVLREYSGMPFAASYFDIVNEGKRVYQLRSTDQGLDVSDIAKARGGGGHRNAAGFSMTL